MLGCVVGARGRGYSVFLGLNLVADISEGERGMRIMFLGIRCVGFIEGNGVGQGS